MGDNNNKAFTFTELIVSITILSILSTIGFISIGGYLSSARDSQRIADLTQVKTAIKTYKNQKSRLPFPENYFGIMNGATNKIAWQGKLGKNISLSTIDEIPLDPKLQIPYLYSITAAKQEFQLAGTLENEDNEIAIVVGDYHSVSKDLLPTLLVVAQSDLDITIPSNKDLFIFNGQHNNLPYSFINGYIPISDGTIFSELLSTATGSNNFSQNSDFETCVEIKEGLKEIGTGTYQIRNEYGILTNTGCTF